MGSSFIRSFVAISLIVLSSVGRASAGGGCAGAHAGGEWPVFGHDANTTRFQDQEHVIGPENVGSLVPKWVLPAAGSFESGAVVSNGCVFIGTSGGDIYSLNAESGQLVWHAKLPAATTLSITNGRVIAQAGTAVAALDEVSGSVLWNVEISPDPLHVGGGSPLAFDDLVIAGVVCPDDTTATAEHPRGTCRGHYSILDAATGSVAAEGWDTSDADYARGMGGAGFWSQPSYDADSKYVYLGNSNARSYAPENPNTSALLKIDAEPGRATFGQIVSAFRSTSLGQNLGNNPAGDAFCKATNGNQLCTGDDDFIQPAIIYHDSFGRKLIGIGHSQTQLPLGQDWPIHGVYLSIDPTTNHEVWRATTDGARAAAAAYDGNRFYAAEGGNGWGGFGGRGGLVALNKDTGAVVWRSETLGDNCWRHVSTANGVVYTGSGGAAAGVQNAGLLMAYDAQTGGVLLAHPMSVDIGAVAVGTQAGGITIARNMVFAPTNSLGGNGYLVAYGLP